MKSINISTVAHLPELTFLVSRKARELYEIDDSLISIRGDVIFTNYFSAQIFAEKINAKKTAGEAVSPAEINAMGLIHEIFHHLIEKYRQTINAQILSDALALLEEKFSKQSIEETLITFIDNFPPLPVYHNELTPEEYLAGTTANRDNRQIALEEMLLLWLSNQNPAFSKYKDLFDDTPLVEKTVYPKVIEVLTEFIDQQPPFGPPGKQLSLVKLLLLPIKTKPQSLVEQLQLLKELWGDELSAMLQIKWDLQLSNSYAEKWGIDTTVADYETRILRAADYIIEEFKERGFPGPAERETHTPDFSVLEEEPEMFSPDTDWMPRLVLIAKSTLVWLDQLSKTYQRKITTLDQIPDEELDKLAKWGFTGLWLIGIWERSPASKTIKQWCGNPDAASSAYSLYDYVIAKELGGEAAYQQLKERAWKRGIRLASDMVPNHCGIVSKWVKEHPDWFISLPYPPFPNYTYSGLSLSDDPTIGIFLEDHYFDFSDAAVTFKYVNYRTGDTRYIYHGNDGTSMPWNDTAQLDYTKVEVREAVIQTIIEVAKRFPIIRFDAAMTLTKRHYQRLWFPQPGTGGDIPSRSQFGLTKAEFDKLMPEEFWREVVDRVQKEVPDTLLLAEAFWMMEGYFVRSLGMHRVYNSAFMNMLKKEENKKYRYTIKNTIEFEPEVLKRYVNFMNNPDEETAINQFGDGDKYFGVCVLMVTMPGLPMFGHGQVEGFREKYGMEFRKAYLDEKPNSYLIARHEREIFPLMKKRYLFAEVEHFLLYDLYDQRGVVNENVFAYSNRYGEERSLVVFHNAFAETEGWIHTSSAFTKKTLENSNQPTPVRRLVQKNLGEGLALPVGKQDYVIFKDSITGLEYIHHCGELWQRGMHIKLKAYEYHVFIDFRFRTDTDGKLAELTRLLNGKGIVSIDDALREIDFQPLHKAFQQVIADDVIDAILSPIDDEDVSDIEKVFEKFEADYQDFLTHCNTFLSQSTVSESLNKTSENSQKIDITYSQNYSNVDKAIISKIAGKVREDLLTLRNFTPLQLRKLFSTAPKTLSAYIDEWENFQTKTPHYRTVLYYWLLLRRIGKLTKMPEQRLLSRSLYDELLLGKVIQNNQLQRGITPEEAQHIRSAVKLLIRHGEDMTVKKPAKLAAHEVLAELFKSSDFQNFCGVNEFEQKLWFKKEALEEAVRWLTLSGGYIRYRKFWQKIADTDDKSRKKHLKKLAKQIKKIQKVQQYWMTAISESQYLVTELIELLHKQAQLKQAKIVADETKTRSDKKRKKQVKKKQTIIGNVTATAKNDKLEKNKKTSANQSKRTTDQQTLSKKSKDGKNAPSSKDS